MLAPNNPNARVVRFRFSAMSVPEAATRIRLAESQNVMAVAKMSDGTFPGMKVSEDSTSVQYFDLSKMPPESRKLNKKDIDGVGNNSEWKHPPGTSDYTTEELSDVISYLRFVAKGDRKPVKLQ